MSKCFCVQHQSWTTGKEFKLIKISHKKIKVGTLNFMKTKKYITSDKASAVCNICVEIAENEMFEPHTKKRRVDIPHEVFISELKNNNVTEQVLVDVARLIGEHLCGAIHDDALSISNEYKSHSFKEDYKVEKWISKRNKVLTTFLMAAANTKSVDENHKKNLYIAGSIDSLYKARHLSTISPVHFYKNLITYYITGSKFVTKLNNTHAPSGSYSCLTNWLKNLCENDLINNETGDMCTFFDNNQVVARNWRVNYNYKTKASVVTTVINIAPSINSYIQNDENMSPSKWLYKEKDHTETVNKVKDLLTKNEQTFRNVRDQFIEQRLNKVKQEMTDGNGALDHIDLKIADGVDPNVNVDGFDNYEWVPSLHPVEAPSVVIAEPAMCNPCSYASVKKVLEHIQNKTVCGDRSWTVVGCDGLPYNLATRLIQDNHHLRNLLIMPGPGHVEMNAVKAIYKMLWEVTLKDLAKLLGYRTPRALVCCLNCIDHHKSWHILKIYFFGTMDELIKQYITKSYSENKATSLQEFYRFIAESGPNVRYVCDTLFNFVFGIYLYRCGIRRNNSAYVMAGRSVFMKLFYVTNMTNYMEIIYKDLKARVLAPDHVRLFLERTESFSVSGHASKGEGGDFVLEAVNGKTKRWLPPGIPTETHWLMVCRSVDKLDKIKESLVDEFGITETKSDKVYQRNLIKEILEWRVFLRKSGYFSPKSYKNTKHVSLSGQKLDRELVYFDLKCAKNFQIYLDNTSDDKIPKKNLGLTPVFVTEEDRNKFHDINRKTKDEITKIIQNMLIEIRELGNITEGLVLEEQWIKIKATTKNDMLQFYKEVVIALEDASSENIACEEYQSESNDSSDEDVEAN